MWLSSYSCAQGVRTILGTSGRLNCRNLCWAIMAIGIVVGKPLAAIAQNPQEPSSALAPSATLAPDVAAPATSPAATGPAAGPTASAKGPSGLALPRFVSLKSDRVNLRAGPGTDYPASWVFRRAGLPLEVTKEFESWRQVRDADGTSGWVLQSFLSGRRTALVLPWDVKSDVALPQVPIMKSDSSSSRTVAIVEAGVIANVHECDSVWCHVTVDTYRGYIEQKKLWGVYDGETIK